MKKIGLVALGLLVACSGAGDSVDQLEDGALTALDEVGANGEWRPLFDGQSLDGWVERGEATWQVDDGSLTPASPGPGFLATAESFGDFNLRLEFWTDTIVNGGVFLRLPAEGEVTQDNAIEINISDTSPEWPTGSVNTIQRHDPGNTTGQWNSYDITAEGDRVVVVLNGETTVDASVPNRLASGPIALQILDQGEIRYRNIEIQER